MRAVLGFIANLGLCYLGLSFFIGMFVSYCLGMVLAYKIFYVSFKGWLSTLGVAEWLSSLVAGLLLLVSAIGLGYVFWNMVCGVGAFLDVQGSLPQDLGGVRESDVRSAKVESFLREHVRSGGISGGDFVAQKASHEPYGVGLSTVILLGFMVLGTVFIVSVAFSGRV